MRISDWSSDVCSSDLRVQDAAVDPHRITDKAQVDIALYAGIGVRLTLAQHLFAQDQAAILARNADRAPASAGDPADDLDWKSVVQGKSVSVRLDLGGRRIINKKNKKHQKHKKQ